ncbi:DUF427 domain-containing protein [Streptomyces sp. 8N706]|uniref:DUF427 domain-containing protein n=1 Tax=Streptomyces sp. 8N706 TaxID=3457416 RepID=UPI003FD6A3BB
MLRAVGNGTVIAETPRSVMVEGNHSFPAEAAHRQYFTESRTRSLCFWKGPVLHRHRRRADQPERGLVPPAPEPLARRITNRVAFWQGVRVESEPENTP